MTVLRVLWSITWGSWLTALAIVLIRVLLRKVLSPKAKYYLWLLLALRLMLPVLPQSSLSVQNVLPQHTATVSVLPAEAPTAPAAEPMPIVEAPTEVADIPAVSSAPTPAPSEKSPFLPTVLLWIYALGVGISALVYLILYLRTARMLSKLPDCTDSDTLSVWQSLRPVLSLPASIRLKRGSQGMSGGLIHPTIVLPLEITGSDAAPILIHEAQHISSHDLWIMSLYRLLRCIYWFNPIVWLCFRQAFFDSEGACDQRVLESGLVSGKDYAQALYQESLLTARDGLYIRTAFGGKHTIRRRITQIARFHGKRRWMLPLALVLVLTISACTLTARPSEDSGASDASDSPSVSDSVSSAESNMVLPAEPSDESTVSAPIFFTDGNLTFLNLPWGSTPEAVMDYMAYTDEDFTLTNRGRNFEADVTQSPPDYPEISKIQYEFHFVGLDLSKGLDGIELFYDNSHVSYDDLLSDCTGFLGTPEQQDDKSANWTTDSAYLTLSNLNSLKLRLIPMLRGTDFETALSTPEEVAAYMDSLMPPGGHYGWTYQQHIDAGLLNPNDGVFTHEDENCDSFVTTINLGGEDVEARYYFVRNLPLMETDTRILTEVYVVPPEDVPFREWFAKFSEQYTNKLYQSQVNNFRTPITVGNLLTQEQKDEVGNLALQYVGQYASTEAWYLTVIWRDGDLFKFNGTGYALYFALNDLVTN